MGSLEYDLVRQKFTWERAAAEMKSVYEWVLGQGESLIVLLSTKANRGTAIGRGGCMRVVTAGFQDQLFSVSAFQGSTGSFRVAINR